MRDGDTVTLSLGFDTSKPRARGGGGMTGGADRRIRLGVSACLLGEQVRFDSGHKRDAFLVDELGRFVDWVPVCPEVESGMGTPRESLRLTRSHHEIRLVANKSEQDHSASMAAGPLASSWPFTAPTRCFCLPLR